MLLLGMEELGFLSAKLATTGLDIKYFCPMALLDQ